MGIEHISGSDVDGLHIEVSGPDAAERLRIGHAMLSGADVVVNPAQRTGSEAVTGGPLWVAVGRHLVQVPRVFGLLYEARSQAPEN